MTAAQNKRIKSLSTRYLGFYKNSVPVIIILVLAIFSYWGLKSIRENGNWFSIVQVIVWMILTVVAWYRANNKVHRVEFDDEFLYVIQKGQDILIPLENIKEVDIKSVGGVYEVELFNAEQLGKTFYFKPSLLYPFNYKKKDALVNILRNNINKALRKKQHFQTNALHS